ncbi:MAG TPA: GLUG motif-containing protein [Candidatus Hydrogenedentes bacterium]|nr:GLUG motif-containing protein [Candidatus Hydrogenedentota bacterium]
MGKVRFGILGNAREYLAKETRDSHARFLFVRGLLLYGILALGVLTSAYGDAIPIASIEELQKIGNDAAYPLDGDYILTQDIDASDTVNWNDGAGFEPIGINYDSFFSGSFNGQNHTISGLTINHPDEEELDVGLFRCMDDVGKIENLGLLGGSITGGINVGGFVGRNYGSVDNCYGTEPVAGINNIGVIVGWNSGEIMNCSATGGVTGEESVGGLAGANCYGRIAYCYATGAVAGVEYLGGLAGSSYNGTIMNCYATGSVWGSYSGIGGLLGKTDNNDTITNCYATGGVTGEEYVGGLVGSHYESTITNCYSMGAVTGEEYVGGLAGRNLWGTVTNSFWDTQTSGQISSGGGEGKTTIEMMHQSTFLNWDFGSVWNIHENASYPYLLNMPEQTEGEDEGITEGEGEGMGEGENEGSPTEGEIEGIEEGEGILEGEGLGEGEGNLEGEAEGLAEGFAEGGNEGALEGEGGIEGESEGAVGSLAIVQQPRGAALYVGMSWTAVILVEGGEGAVVYDWKKNGTSLGWPSAMVHIVSPLTEGDAGVYRCTVSDGVTTLESQEAVLSVYPIPPSGQHVVDQNGDWAVGLSELLRVVQFFNSGGFHCDAGSEDGYAPGAGDQTCAAYEADYAPQDWIISLSELLRIIQFFNSGCYHVEAGTEDGYAPGAG